MKTFLEFAREKKWDILEDINKTVDQEVVKIGNILSKKDDKIVPGMTDPNKIKQAMGDPRVVNLANKSPQAAGNIAAYLGGDNVADKLKK